jgi:hypothetical protein
MAKNAVAKNRTTNNASIVPPCAQRRLREFARRGKGARKRTRLSGATAEARCFVSRAEVNAKRLSEERRR